MSASANSPVFQSNLEILQLVEDMRNEAQQALDDLFNEKLIPFKLTVYTVRAQEDGIYTVKDGIYNVQFFDSRFHELSVCWKEGQSLKNIIRAAVLRMTQNPYPASSSLNVHTWPVRPESMAGRASNGGVNPAKVAIAVSAIDAFPHTQSAPFRPVKNESKR